MNLIQSICCLFFCGFAEESQRTAGTRRNESPVSEADLGQTEAGLEKSGKEQMAIWRVTKPDRYAGAH